MIDTDMDSYERLRRRTQSMAAAQARVDTNEKSVPAGALHELLDARTGFAGLSRSGPGKPRLYTPAQAEKDHGLAISTGAAAGTVSWIASNAALNLAHGLMDLRALLQSLSLRQAEGE